MSTDHRHALAHFLRTDRLRLEAALDGATWDDALAQRLTDHLRYLHQVRAVYVEGHHPHAPDLRQELASLAPQSADHALEQLSEQHDALARALRHMPDARFHAPVLDPLDRGLTVLGHLYDLARSSAALISWLQATRATPPEDSLAAWFD